MNKLFSKTLTRTYSQPIILLLIFISCATPVLAQGMNYIMPPTYQNPSSVERQSSIQNPQYQAPGSIQPFTDGPNPNPYYATPSNAQPFAQSSRQNPPYVPPNNNQPFPQNPASYGMPGNTQPFTQVPTHTPASPISQPAQNAGALPTQPVENPVPPTSTNNLTAEQVNQAATITNQAYALSKDGNNEQAIELLNQALAIDPQSVVAHLDLSLALIALKRYDEALNESSTVLQLNPDEEKGYLNYLAAAIGANRMQDALTVGQEYLKRFPNGNNRKTLTNEMVAVEHELDRRAHTRGILPPPGAPDNYLFFVTPYGKRHWPFYLTTLKVYISPGDRYKGFLPIYQTTLISSFMAWQNATRGAIRFIPVSDPSIADIECRWTDSAAGLTLAAEAGDAQVMQHQNMIYHVIITILTCRPDIPAEKLTTSLIQQVCLHEIGHGLGIDGHSDNSQDIMYCATDPNIEHVSLSQRDVNTLFLLYQ